MLKAVFIFIVAVFAVYMWRVCDYFYPGSSEEINKHWDILKHICYLIFAFCIGIYSYIPGNKYSRLIHSILIFWIVPQMILDKGNSYAPQEPSDFYFLPLAIYFGCKDIVPRFHRKTGEFLIGKKIYNYLCYHNSQNS